MGAAGKPLVAIVGETGSGKSALGLELAQRFDGEIICADSRTVYRDMNIGTAKPSMADRALVPHHLLDVATPGERFTVADFTALAEAAIADIQSRGKLPLVVGGTGLYIDALFYNFQFRPAPAPEQLALREQRNHQNIATLQAALQAAGLPLPNNPQNRRHLIRVLETDGAVPPKPELRLDSLLIGLQLERSVLEQRITQRVETMMIAGLVAETERLLATYDWHSDALQTPGYTAFRKYLEGEINLEEAKALFVRADLQLAKRQRTWFKRNKSIHWLPIATARDQYVDLVTTLLHDNTCAN